MAAAMNDVMHDLLNKLRVISKIKEGQKLDITNGLNVYSDGWFNLILRKWYRDNKVEGIRFLRDLYKSLQQSVETIINESKAQNAHVYVLVNTACELKASIKGLDNLCKTYANFPTAVAALDGLLKDYVIVTYSTLLESIPKDKLVKDLCESITYGGNIVFRGTNDENADLP